METNNQYKNHSDQIIHVWRENFSCVITHDDAIQYLDALTDLISCLSEWHFDRDKSDADQQKRAS